MTNGWVDMKNTDMMLIMGGNPAENHPCGFKWPIEAKRTRNAKIISVDPRFTRTSAVADLFCQIRAGTDIAFLGGVVHYAIENNRIAKDYLVNYTNAAFIVKSDFKLPADTDGVFSGFDAKTQSYDKSTWNYAGTGGGGGSEAAHPPSGSAPPAPRLPEKVEFDLSLQNPKCVFQLLKKHYSRYTPEMVERITGIPKEQFLKAADLYTSIRKDGYLKVPTPADTSFDSWMKRITPTSSKPAPWDSFNYWGNTPKFAASYLKALYGDAATKQNGFAFDYLPKVDRNYSWVQLWDDMYNGVVKGMLAFGMNGVAIGPDSKKNINALKKADWLVVGEIYPDETSEFWKSPGITQDEMKQIQTTVYRLPCAGFAEKDGSFTNSARWLLWKNTALPTPGDCRLDQAIVAQIFLKIRELYKKDGGKFPDPILNLTWNYSVPSSPSLAEVLKEINGKALADLEDPATKQQIKTGQQLPGFAWLKDDGTTSCGNWIYSGSFTEAGNQTARRDPSDPSGLGVHPGWGWSWPANRSVLYNRASCDVDGKPWDPTRKQVWWNADLQKWVGNDVPDFKVDSKPKDHMGPFIMNPEGVGRIFGPLAAFADGPFPEFYEPIESPIDNPLHPAQTHNPVVKRFKTPEDKYATPKDGYTIVCTTYRMTEHYHYWTKNNPMNVQLVPEPFVEIPAELANDMGLHGGEKIKVSSIRGDYIAKAMVTKRIKPMMIDGKKVYQIGIPIHQGYRGIKEDESKDARTLVNLLTPTVFDPNAYTPEFKGFLVKLEKA